ncbi:MAG: DUF1080 domain-containing protein, partial [Planctomycetota bacterium]
MTPSLRVLFCVLVCCVGLRAAAGTQPEPIELFDGKTLDGWTAMFGGSIEAWAVEDGEIRVVNAGRGGWLRTERMYRDFELELQFIIPAGGNSGIGL